MPQPHRQTSRGAKSVWDHLTGSPVPMFAALSVPVALAAAGVPIAAVVAVPATAVLGLFAYPRIRAARAWHPPQLNLNAAEFVLRGEAPVGYQRDAKQIRDVGVFQLQCTFSCTESISTKIQNTTQDERVTVFSSQVEVQGRGTPTGIAAEFVLQIPTHAGAPSFALPHNRVEWFIETKLIGSGLPEDTHQFPVHVFPDLSLAPRPWEDHS